MFFSGRAPKGRGVGSIIGAAFILLIILTGYTYYSLHFDETKRYASVLQEMQELDLMRNAESVEVEVVSITSQNKLNITTRNAGSYQTHIIWLGIYDASVNSQVYYEVDFYIDPGERVTDIGNDSITIQAGDERRIQLITELGNIFECSYPWRGDSGGDGAGGDGWGRYDWVDEICDLYPPTAVGKHGLFSAQQAGPDGVHDTLTEENPGIQTLIDQESFEGDWPPTGWSEDPGNSRWNKEESQSYDGNYSADFDSHPKGISGDLLTPNLDTSDATSIFVDFWYRDEDCEPNKFLLQYYNGTGWNNASDLGSTLSEYQWLHYHDNITDNQYFISNFKIRWSILDLMGIKHAYVDLVTVKKETTVNYQLDLEVRWTEADFDEANEWLCIYGGDMGAEDIIVDVWDGSEWVTVFDDLVTGWNSLDISSYLVSPTFTIRFRGGTETGDTTQDSWEIDSTFIQTWTETE